MANLVDSTPVLGFIQAAKRGKKKKIKANYLQKETEEDWGHSYSPENKENVERRKARNVALKKVRRRSMLSEEKEKLGVVVRVYSFSYCMS